MKSRRGVVLAKEENALDFDQTYKAFRLIVGPLLLPAAALPSGSVHRDHLLHGFGESGNGRAAAGHEFAPLPRHEVEHALLAGFGEADVGPGPESEVAGTSVHRDALAPGLRELAARDPPYPEGETSGAAAVDVASGFPDGLDKARGESVRSFGHGCVFPAGSAWVAPKVQERGSLRRSGEERYSTISH